MTALSDFFSDFLSGLNPEKLLDILRYDPQSPLIFSSGTFLWLFILFLGVYMLMGRTYWLRIVYVVGFSLFFYYKSSGLAVILLLLATTSDFFIARCLSRATTPRGRKGWVLLSLLVNLGILSYFKYFNFIGTLLVGLVQEVGLVINRPEWIMTEWTTWDIVLPVGISFYTFQTMSYIIDVYRGDIKPLGRWIEYVFYVSFFPQLVAGPIVRAKDFIPQIGRKPFLGRAEYGEALMLIMSGLFKKAIISDYISLNFVDRIFDAPTLYTGVENLLGVYGYALQIYCDFSGYSDMAIGIALILGFRFNINFDSPYRSASITEFWRRWHISLSSWLRDYLYIPLGGNRKGTLRTYLNLLITMLLGGLWHGAASRFVLWGAIHGVALALHKLWCRFVPSSARSSEELPVWRRWLGRILTFHLVCLAWIFFRAEDMPTALAVLEQITSHFHPEVLWQFVEGYRWVVVLMALGYLLHLSPTGLVQRVQRGVTEAPFALQVLMLTGLIFLVIQMRSAEVQPFIYFQF